MLLRPTVASLVQKTKLGLTRGLRALGLEVYLCRGLDRRCAGIAIPVDGVLLSLPHELSAQICQISSSFFGPKLLRKAADLAKPMA